MALGTAGEAAVARWYEHAGWRVLDRNWRDGRLGEIDLVVVREGVIAFCEVKTRSGTGFGLPSEAVGFRKQSQLRRLAAAWLSAHDVRHRGLRFDVASVMWPRGGQPTIEVIEGAF